VRRERGFSLIEVLCSLLILGVGLVGITEGITLALASSRDAERHTRAVLLATGRLELLRAEGYLFEGEEEGTFGDDFPGYRWAQDIAKTDLEGLYQVTVMVEDAKTEELLYELRTLLFDMPFSSDLNSSTSSGSGRSGYGSYGSRRGGGYR